MIFKNSGTNFNIITLLNLKNNIKIFDKYILGKIFLHIFQIFIHFFLYYQERKEKLIYEKPILRTLKKLMESKGDCIKNYFFCAKKITKVRQDIWESTLPEILIWLHNIRARAKLQNRSVERRVVDRSSARDRTRRSLLHAGRINSRREAIASRGCHSRASHNSLRKLLLSFAAGFVLSRCVPVHVRTRSFSLFSLMREWVRAPALQCTPTSYDGWREPGCKNNGSFSVGPRSKHSWIRRKTLLPYRDTNSPWN